MELTEQFDHFLDRYQLKDPAFRFAVAVSGGLDSVVLAWLCYRHGLRFIIAHCNFQLRGEESERDAAFVQALGQRFDVPVLQQTFDTESYAANHKLSIQEAARKLRYDWFDQIREEHKLQFILLAHHADDQIETLLFNFFRGSGLDGLTGMPERTTTNCLRPLLHTRRSEIFAYAQTHELKWVEDSSNSSSKYTRNYFRNELIPQIRKVFPQVEDNLLHNLERLQKTALLYHSQVAELKNKWLQRKGNEYRIPVSKVLQFEQSSFIYELIRSFGFGEKQVPGVLKLCHASSGRYLANDQYQIIRHRRWLIFAPVNDQTVDTFIIEDASDRSIRFGDGIMDIKQLSAEDHRLENDMLVAQIDAGLVSFPLILRRWKEGDYFYPLGMPGKKKIARFLIDQKMSKTEKERIWVLESAQRIIWVVGLRIDHRVRITDKTKKVLRLQLAKLSP